MTVRDASTVGGFPVLARTASFCTRGLPPALLEKAYEAVRTALQDRSLAEAERRRVLSRFIYLDPAIEGQPLPAPPEELTAEGMREIMETERRCDGARDRYLEALRYYRSLI